MSFTNLFLIAEGLFDVNHGCNWCDVDVQSLRPSCAFVGSILTPRYSFQDDVAIE